MKPLVMKTIAVLVLFSASLVSCKKSSSHVKTKTELLTQTTWRFDHATATGFGDITTQIPACYKDNITTFVSNGTGTIDESTNICSPSTAGSFTWSFQSNETILHLSTILFTGGSGDFTIISLTETNLIISQLITISPLPATTVEFTFKH